MAEVTSTWKVCSLADTAERGGLVGGPFGSSLGTKDYVECGVPVIRGQNLGGPGRFNSSEFVYVTESKADELRRNLALPGDIIFTQRGTLGQVGIVPSGEHSRYVISQSQMRLRPDPTRALSEYIYYVFRSPSMLDMIHARAIVTGVPHINLGILAELSIELPPIAEQRAIVDVLGALDDKIASNHRINRQLKEVSELRLRQAVGSPIGELIGSDESIRCVQIDGPEIAIVKPGLGAADIGDEYEYLATAVVFDNSYERGEFGTLANLPSRANMRPGDDRVWFARMKSTEKTLWTPGEFNRRWLSMILSTGFLGIQSADSRLAPLLMTAVRCREFGEIKDQLCNGTTMQSLNNDAARSIWFRLPANEFKLAELSSDIRNNLLFEARLNAESETLKSVRDALIPELLSGRLRVQNAERVVEAAV